MRLTAIVVALAVVAAAAQEPLRLEAASIKPALPFEPGISRFDRPGPDVFDRAAATLQQLVEYAYDVPRYRVLDGPAWMNADRFEVTAKANRVFGPGETRPLVRQLLEERFRLKAHRETRELPIYNLVFARGDHRFGPGLQVAPVDCTPFRTGQRPISESPTVELRGGYVVPRCGFRSTWDMRTGATSQNWKGIPMAEFVRAIANAAGRDVHDQTGLTGLYDFDVTFVSPTLVSAPGLPRPNGEGPSLTTALIDELGLKLEPAKGPVDVVVIDAAERPTPN